MSIGENYTKLFSKIESLKGEQIDMVDKFVDVFLDFNSKQSSEKIDQLLQLTDQINDYAYKNGMSKELAEKLIREIS